MKKIILVAIIIFTATAAYGQLVRPNRPNIVLDGRPGYITINELALGSGLAGQTTAYSKHYFGFTTMHGYQANEIFTIGAGTGLLFYNDGLLIPLYADLRVRLSQSYLAPYLSGSAGVLLNPDEFNAGTRMFIEPGAGLLYSLSRKMAINLSAGLKIQMAPNISRASFLTVKFGLTNKF